MLGGVSPADLDDGGGELHHLSELRQQLRHSALHRPSYPPRSGARLGMVHPWLRPVHRGLRIDSPAGRDHYLDPGLLDRRLADHPYRDRLGVCGHHAGAPAAPISFAPTIMRSALATRSGRRRTCETSCWPRASWRIGAGCRPWARFLVWWPRSYAPAAPLETAVAVSSL